ncbi:MAG: ArsR/SmtB family transcription factor [Candidatus Kariarchaeaceae archaeon]|jgi:predicted ArsR family transcriptional regulator
MSEENNEKKDRTSLENELSKIKQEMSDIKEMLKEQRTDEYDDEEEEEIFVNGDPTKPRKHRAPRKPRAPRAPRRAHSFRIDLDPEEFDFDTEGLHGVSDTLSDYMQTVFQGVSENLRNSVQQMSQGFRSINIEGARKAQRVAESELRNVKHSLKSQERNLKREMKRAQKEMERAVGLKRGRGAVMFKTLSEEELEEFYKQAPAIVGALSDTRRLKLLKGLERRPMYQGDLSETLDIKGGTFKHHMDALIQSKFVHQEKTRGRYLITQLGMEALKLAEMLFRRYTFEEKKEIGVDVEVDLEDDEIEVNVTINEDEIEDLEEEQQDAIEDMQDQLDDLQDQTDEALEEVKEMPEDPED